MSFVSWLNHYVIPPFYQISALLHIISFLYLSYIFLISFWSLLISANYPYIVPIFLCMINFSLIISCNVLISSDFSLADFLFWTRFRIVATFWRHWMYSSSTTLPPATRLKRRCRAPRAGAGGSDRFGQGGGNMLGPAPGPRILPAGSVQ